MGLNLNNRKDTFREYFHTIINNHVEVFINDLTQNYDTYLFSGILRNFFLDIYEEPRDLDIVIYRKNTNNDLITILKEYDINYKINSFGGFKLRIKNLSIDLWHIEDTWAIKNKIVKVEKNYEQAILKSTFFNFSSILYNFKKDIFIYDSIFENFLSFKTIDIVLKENPSELLCIINIIYYAEKYELNLSKNTKNYFLKYFLKYTNEEYDFIQKKHFNKILYDYVTLNRFYKNLQSLSSSK